MTNSPSPTTETVQLLLKMGELAHQWQLERGRTGLFVDSEGEIFSSELRTQYLVSDKALDDFRDSTKQYSKVDTDPLRRGKLENLLAQGEKLSEHRSKVQKEEISYAAALNAYTYKYVAPILDICVELALQLPQADPVKVSAYSNYLQWKERLGRERAWGAHGFCSKAFRNREFSERMISLIEEQGAYQRAFFSLAAPDQKAQVESVMGGYVMECLDFIHDQLAETDNAEGLEAISPITWFELLTGKIDRLHLAGQNLVCDLDHSAGQAVAMAAKSPRTNLFEPYMPLIKALPAFSKLADGDLDNLLSHGDVRNYDKGQILFMQGETLSRYYLILEGWVKIFKGTDSGDEAILQMLSAGDSLMEAAVFLNIPSIVSAQIVQNTTLLSIPAPIVRQSLMENAKFALNMIGSLSLRSQGLIQQIEHSRLKTASERVGWFLLKLGIEQSGGESSAITLPYDKSTTASYLDMTPETFSRALKQFRNKGFSIENDKIIKPTPTALCQYCDETLAAACIYKDEENCPQTYID